MATAIDSNHISSGSFLPTSDAKSASFVRLSKPPHELHEAVYTNDLKKTEELLKEANDVVNVQDCHGNTPLHLAVMLGHAEIIEVLLKNKASVKEKNSLGWTPLNESISYGDRLTISLLLKRVHDEMKDGLIERRFHLIQALKNLDDFYAELKWEFHTWVPLLSRLLPSDVCRIYKTGCCIRLDSTLGDFSEMQWGRGDNSFIYNGENEESSKTLSVVALDNNKKVYQRLSLNSGEDIDVDLDDHIDSMMTKPIVYANMSTKPIVVTRAQSGFLFFKTDRSETVGNYSTDVYNISDLILISRKRREHLTPEQIKKHEELVRKVEKGDIANELSVEEDDSISSEHEHCTSLPRPSPPSLSWDEYISIDKCPFLGRPVDLKVDRKVFKATTYITQQCPIDMKRILDILEVIAPYKHFHKLREFVSLRLPSGFPVKIEIPVFPTVTATITLQRYEQKQFPPSQFLIPRNYTKHEPKGNNDEDIADKS